MKNNNMVSMLIQTLIGQWGNSASKMFFFQSCAIQFGLKSWGPGPPGPPPLYSFISAKIMRIFTKNDSQRKKNLKANSCQWYQKKWLNSCVFACVCVYKGLKLFWGTGFHLQSKSVSFLWVMILFLHVETGRVWTLFAGASFPLHNVAKKEKNNNLYYQQHYHSTSSQSFPSSQSPSPLSSDSINIINSYTSSTSPS